MSCGQGGKVGWRRGGGLSRGGGGCRVCLGCVGGIVNHQVEQRGRRGCAELKRNFGGKMGRQKK